MHPDEIKDLIYDTLEQRFEAFAASQGDLHKEYHDQMMEGVKEQIKTTVNGKIDMTNRMLSELDKRIQPFEYTRSWFVTFRDGVVWIAGVLTPIGVIWFVISRALASFK